MRYIFILSVFSIAFTSCIGYRTNTTIQGKNASDPFNYHVVFQKNDFEQIGEATDSITYTNYLGLINSNKDFRHKKRGFVSGVSFAAIPNVNGNGIYMSRILYAFSEKFPNADLIMPIKITERKHKMFLGSKKRLIIRAKIYKLK